MTPGEQISILDFIPVGEHAAILNGTSTYDATSGVQDAVDAAIAQRRTLFANGHYRLTSTINIAGSLTIEGEGCEMQVGNLGAVQTRGKGSWFHLDHAGVGFLLEDPTQYRSGIEIRKIGTYRNQPSTTGGSFTPANFDFDFVVARCDACFEDISLYNPTQGILHRTGGYGRLSIDRLRGQPLRTGIQIQDSADVCRLRGLHFWPFFSNASPVRQDMLQNATAIVLNDVDNPELESVFTIGYATALACLPENGSGDMPVKVRLNEFDFDNGGRGIRIASGGANGVTMLIANGYILGSSSAAAGSSNIAVEGDDAVVLLDNVGLDLPKASCIDVTGARNTLQIANISIGRWNFGAAGAPAINNNGTNSKILLSGKPIVTAPPTGATPWFGGTGVIQCPLLDASTLVTTDAAGRANITHGLGVAPRILITNSYGNAFRQVQAVSAGSTFFTVEVRDAAGAVVALTQGIPVHFRLSY